ncbi:solute carrier family 23 protein [Segniliparus rugosus]|uniref:SLC26A/SulP transporter domain-containing protein n=1 Tax=Segniliparus rugosus (strain ATCC BAA-974 / DSM 45345 / CCUG 50838 / CIP 108380 / JCM 13579 / CDC 945) TaxID=679197 RepID=U1M1C0_SEGRC|nr:bifunctional SulP family inorganic anion transporter/carbonic anhydrase [Segniliparus rugosus]ERG69182.1 hypothetical protein HMPREF9336_04326 [Segniliparus rugosus ATCC BAA-974]
MPANSTQLGAKPAENRSDAPQKAAGLRSILRYDLPASFVVFLVALPLSIGLAVASSGGVKDEFGNPAVPIMAGIIAAIVGGVVAGFLGGSSVQVSGAANGATVVVAGLVAEFGFKTVCIIVIVSGVLQILLGISRVARATLAISPVVVHAMLAGIGITLALQQIHIVLGGKPGSTTVRNLAQLPDQIRHLDYHDALIGAVVIALLLLWKRFPKAWQKVPASLVAILVAGALVAATGWAAQTIIIDDDLLSAIQLPNFSVLPGVSDEWTEIVTGIITVTIMCSVESLVSAVAADKLHSGPRTNLDRELVGQGVANMTSGFLGGLPITGVIVRSSANISAGGRTRASTILHGVWMLVFALLFLGVAGHIPTAALAGLLVVVGVQLIKLAEIRKARKTGDLLVYGVTILGVVFLNLLQGVILGLIVALGLVLWRVVRVHIAVLPPASDGAAAPAQGSGVAAAPVSRDRWQIAIEGSATFLALPKLTEAFAEIPKGAPVTIVMAVDFLDHGIQSAIEDWCFQHETSGGSVIVQEVGPVDLGAAGDAPPKRGSLGEVLRRGLTPWDSWQPGDAPPEVSDPDSTAHPAVRSVLAGVAHYHRRHAPLLLPHLEKLRERGKPDILFITCGDSRIVPNVITASGPGDLFTIRNVGNLVKPAGTDPAMDAALFYTIEKLGVSSVVLCGHSSCGAMADTSLELPPEHPMRVWLDRVDVSRGAYAKGHPVAAAAALQGYGANDQLGIVNVVMQVRSLREHPIVMAAAEERGLSVTGLFFDISTGQVLHVEEDEITVVDDKHPLLLNGEGELKIATAAFL